MARLGGGGGEGRLAYGPAVARDDRGGAEGGREDDLCDTDEGSVGVSATRLRFRDLATLSVLAAREDDEVEDDDEEDAREEEEEGGEEEALSDNDVI